MQAVSAIRLAASDDVAVVLDAAREGDTVQVAGPDEPVVVACSAIPQHHKVALVALAKGQDVRRGGVVIGKVTADIEAGEHVHVHNLESLRARPPE